MFFNFPEYYVLELLEEIHEENLEKKDEENYSKQDKGPDYQLNL